MKVEIDIESLEKAVVKYLKETYEMYYKKPLFDDKETEEYLKALKVVLSWHMVSTDYDKWSKKYDS